MKNMKTLLRQKILIMRHNKFFATAIALCAIALFTIGSVPSASASTPTPVTITATFDFSGVSRCSGNLYHKRGPYNFRACYNARRP